MIKTYDYKRAIILLPLLFMLSMLASCIEEYALESRAIVEADIVIQGRILSGDKSIIYITRTQPLNSEEEAESVLNAQISIIGQNGYESEPAEFDIENDCYTIDTRNLPNNTLYALKVEAEGETYQSDFQSILAPPEIDEISYKEREDGISILPMVTLMHPDSTCGATRKIGSFMPTSTCKP